MQGMTCVWELLGKGLIIAVRWHVVIDHDVASYRVDANPKQVTSPLLINEHELDTASFLLQAYYWHCMTFYMALH